MSKLSETGRALFLTGSTMLAACAAVPSASPINHRAETSHNQLLRALGVDQEGLQPDGSYVACVSAGRGEKGAFTPLAQQATQQAMYLSKVSGKAKNSGLGADCSVDHGNGEACARVSEVKYNGKTPEISVPNCGPRR